MSTFVLKKEYALQLPNNYVEINKDEMEYVDGGYRASRTVYIPQRSFRMKTADYIDANSRASSIIGIALGTLSAACGVGLLAGTVVALASDFALSHGSTSADALNLDRADGSYDGWLTVTIGGKWVTEINPYPMHSYEGATF